MATNKRLCFVQSCLESKKRGRSQHRQIKVDRARKAHKHDQQTEIMTSNQHRFLEKLLSTDLESSFGDALPKIQLVQPYLRENNLKYYTPKLLSIGPIHHNQNLLQGEKYKFMWAKMYLKDKSKQDAEQLLQKIRDELPTLKGLYTEDAMKGHQDEDLARIFFVDGCAVLYFLEKVSDESLQELIIKADQLMIVQQDLLLLENQLPFRVLKLLSNHDEPKLFKAINKFFIMFGMIPDKEQLKENNTIGNPDSTKREEVQITVDHATHLLHLLRNEYKNEGKDNNTSGGSNSPTHEEVQITVTHLLHLLCIKYKIKRNSHDVNTQAEKRGVKSLYTHRNIQELKASGIQVKKNKKNARRTLIKFETSLYFRGRLCLSTFFVDGSTASTLLNMIALEMCPDFRNNYEISSYVVFLDSLIDNVDDVKELRKAGILFNMLGSDEDVTKLFNTISTNLVHDEKIYHEVRDKMERHYRSKNKLWMTQACYSYFSNPWSFLAFVAALTALILTFIQTWFAVYPSHNA